MKINGKLVVANALPKLTVSNPRISGHAAELRTSVISSDDKMWMKIGVSDTDWEQVMLSKNGEYVANILLEEIGDAAISNRTLALSNNKLVMGDGSSPGGRGILGSVPTRETYRIPDATVKLVVVSTATSFDIRGDSDGVDGSTGYWYSINGGTAIYNANTAGGSPTTIPCTPNVPIEILLWTGAALDSTRFGDFTYVTINDTAANKILLYDTSSAGNIGSIYIYRGYLRYVNGSVNPAIVTAYIDNSTVGAVSLTGCGQVTWVHISSVNELQFVDISDCPLVDMLQIKNSPDITHINISNLNAINQICDLSNCAIETVVGHGFVGPTNFMTFVNNVVLNDNMLTTDAVFDMLNTFGNAATVGRKISLAGNPCVSGGVLVDGVNHTAVDTIAIATGKGYVLTYT